MSETDLAPLEPRLVWSHFLELTRIPRPSREEAAVREHLLAWAAERGFDTVVDGAGNLVVRVPATTGRGSAPSAALQAHLDMVCERDPESPYDAREGRIALLRDGDWIAADGTTLGADNGIGVAAALAVAEDDAVVHGPLELLFTVSEEQGLVGAKALDPALLPARRLVNLDGTSDRGLTVGCAGSTQAFVRLRPPVEPLGSDEITLDVSVSGVRGGHSGEDIARGRINAVKALARVLLRARAAVPFRLARFDGGVSRNAIPREAHAVVSLRPGSEHEFREAAERELVALREQYAGTDDGVRLAIEQSPETSEAWTEEASATALQLVQALPTGVLAMTPAMPAEVESSTSLGVAHTVDGVLTLASMARSSRATALEDAVASFRALATLAGAELEIQPSYPPWQPDLDSDLLTKAGAAFLRIVGHEPELTVVHGGLECAVIGEKVPGLEMISIGAEIEGQHAPGERVSVPGTQRFYRLLSELLDDLSR